MVPVPAFVNATLVDDPFSIIPEKEVDVLFPPAVNVGVPAAELVTVPAPESEPNVSEKPAKSKVAPLATVIALLSLILSALPERRRIPALTMVEPS